MTDARDFDLQPDMLSAYLDDELTEPERAAVEARLEVSTEWQAELAEVESARAIVRGLPVREAPPGFWERVVAHVGSETDAGIDTPGIEAASPVPITAARGARRGARVSRGRAVTWLAGAAAAVAAVVVVVSMPGRDTVKPNVTAVVTQHGASTANSGDPISGLVPVGISAESAPMTAPLTMRRWRALPLALVVLVALPWAVSPFTSEAAEKSSSTAAQLVEQMRTAPLTYDFEGVVELQWRDGKKVQRATATVRGVDGSIEVDSAVSSVVDYGATTYVLGKSGWTSVGVMATPANLPAADHAWTLTSRAGSEIAGRPTTTVLASRSATGVVQKVAIDTETGLLLERQVRDRGRLERSLRFTSLTIGAGPTPAKAGGPRSTASPIVPDGLRAPREPGGGYVLVASRLQREGVQLSYSDGLFTVSIHEQHGALDWDSLPAGGRSLDIAGHQARHYTEPGNDVIVWERDGVVYTCVTDAPTGVIDAMIAGLSPSGRSTVEKAVDFVLGPFGWD